MARLRRSSAKKRVRLPDQLWDLLQPRSRGLRGALLGQPFRAGSSAIRMMKGASASFSNRFGFGMERGYTNSILADAEAFSGRTLKRPFSDTAATYPAVNGWASNASRKPSEDG